MPSYHSHQEFVSMYGEETYAWPSVSDEAKRIYPGVTFDTAFPQPWLDAARDRFGKDVRGHGVWGYPAGATLTGMFLPITQEGVMIAALMATAAGLYSR